MNKYGQTCHPKKKKRKKACPYKKIGALLLFTGLIALCSMFLPLKCWFFILCGVLILCGYLLLK